MIMVNSTNLFYNEIYYKYKSRSIKSLYFESI